MPIQRNPFQDIILNRAISSQLDNPFTYNAPAGNIFAKPAYFNPYTQQQQPDLYAEDIKKTLTEEQQEEIADEVNKKRRVLIDQSDGGSGDNNNNEGSGYSPGTHTGSYIDPTTGQVVKSLGIPGLTGLLANSIYQNVQGNIPVQTTTYGNAVGSPTKQGLIDSIISPEETSGYGGQFVHTSPENVQSLIDSGAATAVAGTQDYGIPTAIVDTNNDGQGDTFVQSRESQDARSAPVNAHDLTNITYGGRNYGSNLEAALADKARSDAGGTIIGPTPEPVPTPVPTPTPRPSQPENNDSDGGATDGTQTGSETSYSNDNASFADDAAVSSGGGGDSGGGGKIVCTDMNNQYGFGSYRQAIWLKYSENMTKEHEVGYHAIFRPLLKVKAIKPILHHIARHRTADLRAEMYNRKRDTLGQIYRSILEPICYLTGKIIGVK